MDDKKTPPIEEGSFLWGVNIVDIGDIRVSRGLTRRPHTSCLHQRISYDNRERRVWCRDCESDIEPFDAFERLVGLFDKEVKKIEARKEKLSEIEGFKARSLAAREVDKAWRARSSVPACPHCKQGLFPEDFKDGITTLGREFAEAQRKAKHTD